MKLAMWAFKTAAIFGLIVMVPMLLMEKLIAQAMPPEINHPEFFYGFVLLNIGWQIVYLIISKDPVRYRMMMLPAIFAKGSAPIALLWLYFRGRISSQWVTTSYMDGAFAILFVISFFITKPVTERGE